MTISTRLSIDWSSIFGSAFESASESVADSVFGRFVNWIYTVIFDGLADFFTNITSMGAEIFNLSWVEAVVQFFELFGWALFAVGLVVSAFDLAIKYQNGRANIKSTALNWIKGFFAVNLFTTVPVALYKECVSLQNTLAKGLVSVYAAEQQSASISKLAKAGLTAIDNFYLGGTVSTIYLLLCLIALGYCVIKIFFENIKRGGIMLIQIAVGSLYMFSIPRGYADGFNNWAKQVIGLCLTAFLQATLLILGLMTFTDNMLLGVGIMLAAKEVPRIAERFGLETAARPNIQGAVYMASSLIRMVK